MSNWIGILHSSVLVADTQIALVFYHQILGLTVSPNRPDLGYAGAWLDITPEQQIHLIELPNPDPVNNSPAHGGRDRHTALGVRDLEQIIHCLDDANIAYTLSQSGRRALFCRDPDGNAVECIEQH
jgi:glyoxylase I family protein